MQIDLNALADFVSETLDYSPEYEDDAFAFSLDGIRFYCERKRSFFRLEGAGQVLELPRY